MGCCNGLKWVRKWVLGAKMGEKWVETLFSPTLSPFQDFRENPRFGQFKGGGNCPEALPTQHKISYPKLHLHLTFELFWN